MSEENIQYIVLDIETSGFNDGHNVIIQIAYNAYNREHVKVKEINRIIRNNLGYTDYYRKFTTEHIQTHGLDREMVLAELAQYVEKSEFIVGHNIKGFDIPYLAKEFGDCLIPITFPRLLDTMQLSKEYCGFRTIRGSPKFPSLAELCNKLNVSINSTDAHDAQYDVDVTASCFHILLTKGVIKIEDSPKIACIPEQPKDDTQFFMYGDEHCMLSPICDWIHQKIKDEMTCHATKLKYRRLLKKSLALSDFYKTGVPESDLQLVCDKLNLDVNLYMPLSETPYLCLKSKTRRLRSFHYKRINARPKTSTHLPPISEEQQSIVNSLYTNNVVVNSVAGSGKTTCILYIALQNPDKQILCLTYSARLRHETKEKAARIGICNLQVHTFHSFCCRYYKPNCYTDSGIRSLFIEKTNPLRPIEFDIVIPDETQDMTPILYELVCKIAKDNLVADAKVCLFGDENQTIYQFKEASSAFIKNADELFQFNSMPWVKHTLSQSFRVTSEMADFVNSILPSPRIISTKSGNKPRYIICDTFDGNETLAEIKYYIYTLGYSPSDIFILASSVRSNPTKAVTRLENEIKKQLPEVSVFVPSGDECKTTTDLLKNKIAFLSFHQAKGLERKVAIVMDFDINFFWNKACDTGICPNEIYVACTRGKEHLSVVHNRAKQGFPFISWDNVDKYCVLPIGHASIPIAIRRISIPAIRKAQSVTELLRFMPSELLMSCKNMLKIKKVRDPGHPINVPSTVQWTDAQNKTYTESVSEITGTAIPCAYEYYMNKYISIYDGLCRSEFKRKYDWLIQSNSSISQVFHSAEPVVSSSSILSMASCWLTHLDGLYNRLMQIRTFDWITDETLSQCISRMQSTITITPSSYFEYMVETPIRPDGFPEMALRGSIDCLDVENNVMYEFKCVSALEDEHFVQLALYIYLFHSQKRKLNMKMPRFCLYNILTDEMYEIKCSVKKANEIAEKIWIHQLSVDQTQDAVYKKGKYIYQSYWSDYK